LFKKLASGHPSLPMLLIYVHTYSNGIFKNKIAQKVLKTIWVSSNLQQCQQLLPTSAFIRNKGIGQPNNIFKVDVS
jgi:hypothetical protein